MSEEIVWRDIRELTIEGRGWDDTESFYDRLPARAKGVVRDPVWNLSRHSAGICTRFVSATPPIHVRWSLRNESLAMNHMPATGVSGLDLYARDDDGTWGWLGVGRPEGFPTNQAQLAGGLPAGRREFLLYLPLYNGVTAVEVGSAPDALVGPGPPRSAERMKPVVYYGTSIAQGGCASRPGMAHTAILGRWLDRPVINLGFSGNGTMDPELVEFMGELDPAAYVIDCLPNMTAEAVAERTVPLVRILRQARPDAPIVLVEDRTATNARFLPGTRRAHGDKRAALRAGFDELAPGDPQLHYLPGGDFMGDDGEATVDGSHPTDLGFLRQARCMLPLLRQVVEG